MKLRILAVALCLSSSAQAQVNPGTSPLSGAKGGTNNAFMQFTGPATSIKTYGLPNASDTITTIAASQTLTNKTFNCANNTCTVRIAFDVSGLAAGCATWLATASSANLRSCMSDETGTGVLYFQGGDIGTPSAGVGTNLTGTAASLTAGNATKLTTPRAIGIAGSTGLTATGVNFDGTAAINPALTGTLVVANGGTGDTGTAWTTYTPSPACGTATFTVNGSKSKTMGKTTWVQFDATITAIGTCTTNITFNLPNTANSAGGLAGREMVAVGNGTTCGFLPAATAATCSHAQVATVFTVNERIIVSGVYENQ